MSEKFWKSQTRTDPRGLQAAALPCQIISWQGIILCWRWTVEQVSLVYILFIYIYYFYVIWPLFTMESLWGLFWRQSTMQLKYKPTYSGTHREQINKKWGKTGIIYFNSCKYIKTSIFIYSIYNMSLNFYL